MAKPRQITQLIAFISGIHSPWTYKQLEAAADGIVDFKVEEGAEETRRPHANQNPQEVKV